MLKSTYYKYKNNELLKAVAVYTTLSFVIKGISFLITPFFTHYITPEEFGSLNLFLTSIIFLTPLINITANSISNDIINESHEVFSKKLSSYLIFTFLLTCIMEFILFIYIDQVSSFFNLSYYMVLIIPILSFLSFVFEIELLLSRLKSKKSTVFYSTVFKTVLEILLSVLFIIYFKFSVNGRIAAFVITTTLLSMWSIYKLNKKYKLNLKFEKKHILNELKFWGSCLLSFGFVLALTVFDKLIVKSICDPGTFGLYSFANQMGSIFLAISSSIQMAMQPLILVQLKNRINIQSIFKKLNFSFMLFLISGLLLYLIYWIMFKKMLNEKYSTSWHLIKWTLLINVLWASVNSFFILINYFKNINFLNYFGLLGLFILLPLQIFFSFQFGINGLIYTQIIFLTLIFLIFYFQIRKLKLF